MDDCFMLRVLAAALPDPNEDENPLSIAFEMRLPCSCTKALSSREKKPHRHTPAKQIPACLSSEAGCGKSV